MTLGMETLPDQATRADGRVGFAILIGAVGLVVLPLVALLHRIADPSYQPRRWWDAGGAFVQLLDLSALSVMGGVVGVRLGWLVGAPRARNIRLAGGRLSPADLFFLIPLAAITYLVVRDNLG
jgi:hypothetical protein